MAANEIASFAAELRASLSMAGAGSAALSDLTAAAANLQALANSAPGALSEAAWQTAKSEWDAARDAFGATLAKALLGPLAAVPGLGDLAADVGKLGRDGIPGEFDLGPIRLQVGSALLVIQPPKFSGATRLNGR